jgi:hypothetical protein
MITRRAQQIQPAENAIEPPRRQDAKVRGVFSLAGVLALPREESNFKSYF